MPAPSPWKISDLTPAVVKASDGSIRTIAAQRDGSRPGDDAPPESYNMAQMSYLGAFRVDYNGPATDETDNYNEGRLGFRPSDGTTNGAFGSFFMDLSVNFHGIAEFDIPATLSASLVIDDLPNASVLQAGVTLDSKQTDNNGHNRIGFLMYKVTLVSVSLAPSEQQRE